jgi:hypothetical protein
LNTLSTGISGSKSVPNAWAVRKSANCASSPSARSKLTNSVLWSSQSPKALLPSLSGGVGYDRLVSKLKSSIVQLILYATQNAFALFPSRLSVSREFCCQCFEVMRLKMGLSVEPAESLEELHHVRDRGID